MAAAVVVLLHGQGTTPKGKPVDYQAHSKLAGFELAADYLVRSLPVKSGVIDIKDYLVIDELGQTYFERAKLERSDPDRQKSFLEKAAEQFRKTLTLDSEDLAAH